MAWLFNGPEEPSNEEVVAGVDVLKAVWNIESGPQVKEMPPAEIVTDIYNTPTATRVIPPRSRRPH